MISPIRVEAPANRFFVDKVHCVGRLTLLKEYPFLCRLFVRFILWPARMITGRPCVGLSDYALLQWKYSGVELQNACTSEDCAIEEASKPYYFHASVPVDDPLPHKTSVFGRHSFPLSKSRSRYLARKPDVEQTTRESVERLDKKISKLERTMGDV
jgi:hypothetical protein